MLIKPQPRKRKRYKARMSDETKEQIALLVMGICLASILVLLNYYNYKV